MALTFEPGWDDAENHITSVAGLKTRDEVQAVLAAGCSGVSSRDGLTRSLLSLCARSDSRAKVLKGVHQAEDVGWVGATYHITVNIPCGRGSITCHVYFALTVIDKAAPAGTSKNAWRKLPIEQRQHRTFSLVAVSYKWNGVKQWPALT